MKIKEAKWSTSKKYLKQQPIVFENPMKVIKKFAY
jgi:hypothetical protein